MATASAEPKKVAIVGAGPVGGLAALYFSHAGWNVEVYELRSDLRDPQHRALGTGKSINLALSERGINGLRNVGDGGKLLEEVLAQTIPMVGRMIHSGKVGEKGDPINYDNVFGRFIRSADRAVLNTILLDELEKRKNVKVFFSHRLTRLRLDGEDCAEAVFERGETREPVIIQADLIVGADGAHSAVRNLMQRYVKMYYEQTYLTTLWCEFHLPPGPDGDFVISGKHLHIWPKQTYMFIAIPSPDGSFTCTLFMPEDIFASLTTPDAVISFFRENFADVLGLIGEKAIVAQYFNNQHLPLISIRTSPYNCHNRCVIVGDAAHAMVPFYGQGMNAGFESVRILAEHIARYPNDIGKALGEYSAYRQPDAFAIVELAMRNYDEMRSGVTQRGYRARKWVEEFLTKWFPVLGVRTLYSIVSFSNRRYSEARDKAVRQAFAEDIGAGMFAVLFVAGGVWKLGAGRALGVGMRESWRAFRAANS